MFDFHMHSIVSYDSEASAGDMLEAAVAAGLKEICFTDHCDYYTDPTRPPDTFTIEQYRAAYDGLAVPGLAIRKGLEFGMTEWNTKEFRAMTAQYPFDFVIGSVHVVNGFDPYYAEFWQGMDVHTAFRSYLEQVLKCVELHDRFDVLGHLTYVCKSAHNPTHGPVSFEKNRDIADAIMEELVRKDIGMEINTSGVDRAGVFLPSADFLRRFKELGGRIVTVGSDAHDPSRVGQYVPQALALLKDIFGYVCTFQNRQPVFHKL